MTCNLKLQTRQSFLFLMMLGGCLHCPDEVAGDNREAPVRSSCSLDCAGEFTLVDSPGKEVSAEAEGLAFEHVMSPGGKCEVVCAYRDGFIAYVQLQFHSSSLPEKERSICLPSFNGFRGVRPIWYETDQGEILVIHSQVDTHTDYLCVLRPSYADGSISLLYFSPAIICEEYDHRYIDVSSISMSRDCVLEYSFVCDSQDGVSARKYSISVPVACMPK